MLYHPMVSLFDAQVLIHLIFHVSDGHEPAIGQLLETLYLDNSRELQHDFGPRIRDGPVRRRNPVRPSYSSQEDIHRKADVTLISHLVSHSDAVTGLAVSPDHAFFISSSDDKTVKVWDTARLERNVTSKPRHTYGQHHSPVKCVCMLESSHCFASAAEDGSLHVVKVNLTQNGTLPKYGKMQVVREHRVEAPGDYITAMMHYNTGETHFRLRWQQGTERDLQIPPLAWFIQPHIQPLLFWTYARCKFYKPCRTPHNSARSLVSVWTGNAVGYWSAHPQVYFLFGIEGSGCF
jgi:hypothetical protein